MNKGKSLKKILATILIAILVAAGCLTLTAYLYLLPEKPPASQAFINGTILTMDTDYTIAEAVVLEKDRIVAVGNRGQVSRFIHEDTLIHDLKGKTLMPGFIDAHSHFPGSGLSLFTVDLSSPPVGTIESIDDLLVSLKHKAKNTAKGEWVNGYGYDNLMLAENRHPTRDELDEAVPEHPVFLMHVSGHLGVANSLALKQVGITEASPDPEGGHYVRDREGRLTGLLEENAAMAIQALTLDFGIGEFLQMVRHATADYARAGITTAQSGAVSRQLVEGLSLAKMLNMVPLRLELWPVYNDFGADLLNGKVKAEDFNSDTLHLGAIKIIADGSIQGYTGYLSKPYHKPFRGDPNYRGYPRVGFDELVDWISKYHNAGYQLAIHGNGDAAIDDIINAFAQVQKAKPKQDPRLILIHAQMAREDQLDSMQALGITPSFFSAHTYYWGDLHRDVSMGRERAFRISPAFSALKRKLPFSIHLDTPVVPMQPLLGVWSTVNRRSTSGRVIGPGQRIAVMPALRSITLDAAWQMFREEDLGSIEVGKLADLVVLERNPLSDPANIKDITVDMTIVGGVTVYQRAVPGKE